MALVTFSRVSAPAGSWSPTRNPDYTGYVRSKIWHQPKDFSDGGDLYCYSKGERQTRSLKWGRLPLADLGNLLTFVAAIKGGRYAFTFTDTDGASFTASRILSDAAVEWRDVGGGRYEVTLEIEVA